MRARPLLLLTLLAACTGPSLSAGSDDAAAMAVPVTRTLATLGAMIDTFAMDATNLYFTAEDGSLYYWTAFGDGVSTGVVLTVPKSGGSPVALAMGEARPFGIAVDATTVYWSDQGPPPPKQTDGVVMASGSIRSVGKDGGTLTILAMDGNTPDALALDDTGVIWHDTREILRVPKIGGRRRLSSRRCCRGPPVTWLRSAIPFIGRKTWAAGPSRASP